MRLVIDSSILIDKLRGGKHWDNFLEKLTNDSELYLPSIVIFELFSGKSSINPRVAKNILELKKYFQEIPLSWEIAKRAGEINRDLDYILDPPDYIIAASSMEIGAEVVTLNKKHFSRIPGLSLYPI